MTLRRYLESKTFKLIPDLNDPNTLWMKPFFNAPFGFAIWMGAAMRNISIVSLQDYLTSQRKFNTKTFNIDFLPLKAGKSHIFAKYEFKITDKLSRINLKLKCPSDPYLIQYMRMKIVDKSKSLFQDAGQSTQHLVQLDNLKFEPTDQGYLFVIEGVMPYNTTEG